MIIDDDGDLLRVVGIVVVNASERDITNYIKLHVNIGFGQNLVRYLGGYRCDDVPRRS